MRSTRRPTYAHATRHPPHFLVCVAVVVGVVGLTALPVCHALPTPPPSSYYPPFCNATVNSTISWQNGIENLLSSVSSYGPYVVCVEPGNYTGCGVGVTMTTPFNNPVSVVGLDATNRPQLDCASAGRAFETVGSSVVAIIAHIEIRNGVQHTSTYGGAVHVDTGANVTLVNVKVSATDDRAVNVDGSSTFYAISCDFSDFPAEMIVGGASSTVVVSDSVIHDTTAFGNLYACVTDATCLSQSNVYTSNTAGSLALFFGANAEITSANDTFVDNVGTGGAAFKCQHTLPTDSWIINSTFLDNVFSITGAVQSVSTGTSLTIDGCTFAGNSGFGGAVGTTDSRNTVTRSYFQGNTGSFAGAIYSGSGVDLYANHTIFEENIGNRGALYGSGTSSITLGDGAVVRSNTATTEGGGVYVDGGTLHLTSGAVVANNSAPEGGGLYVNTNGDITVGSGVVVEGNNATVANGGGIYARMSSTVTLESGSTVRRNYAVGDGGGVYGESSVVTAQSGSLIEDNMASGGGGGIEAVGTTTVIRGTLRSNNGTVGAAVRCTGGCVLTLGETAVLSGNFATVEGGAVAVQDSSTVYAASGALVTGNSAIVGGGMFARTNAAAAYINCTFSNNYAEWDGGGIHTGLDTVMWGAVIRDNVADRLGGGAFVNEATAHFEVYDCLFEGNSGDNGGLALYWAGTLSVANSVFRNNAGSEGGGLSTDVNPGGTVNALNCTFTGNTASVRGGGVAIKGTPQDVTLTGCTIVDNIVAGGTGGGISVVSATTVTVVGSRVSGNSAALGGGIGTTVATVVITNSSISNNTAGTSGGGLRFHYGGWANLTDVSVYGNSAGGAGSGFQANGNAVLLTGSSVTCNEGGNNVAGVRVTDSQVYLVSTAVSHNYYVLPGRVLPAPGTTPLYNLRVDSGNVTGYTHVFAGDLWETCPNVPGCSGSECGDGTCYLGSTSYPALACNCTGTGYIGTACTDSVCGDGIQVGSEQCDDGNAVSGDGCDNCTSTVPTSTSSSTAATSSSVGATTTSTATMSTSSVDHSYCGDGVKDVGEQCDDGNSNSRDACRNDCTRQRPPSSGGCTKDEWRRKSGCEPCPQGGYCDGSTWCLPKKGYWSKSPYHVPIKCGVQEACPGVVDEEGNYLEGTVFDGDGNPVTAVCGADYGDEVCAKCKGKRFKDNQRCVPCPNAVVSTTSGLVVVFAALIVVVAISVVVLSDKQLDMFVAGLLALQMFILVGRDATRFVPGGFGDRVSTVYRYFSVITFDLDFLQLGCSRGQALDFVEVFWGTVALIAIAYAVFVAAALINVTIRWCRGKLVASFWYSSVYHIIHVTVLLGVAAYVQVALRVIQSIDCLDVEGEPRLRVELSTKCYANEHSTAATVAWILMALYLIGFPIFVFYVAWNRPAVLARKKRHPDEDSSLNLHELSMLSSDTDEVEVGGKAEADKAEGGVSDQGGTSSGSGNRLSSYTSASEASHSSDSGEEEEQIEVVARSDEYSYDSGGEAIPLNKADAEALYAYRTKYGFLIRNLHRHAYWFQALRLAVLFVVVLELVTPRSTSSKLFGGVIILATNVIVVGLVWPFKNRLVNLFQMGSGLVTAFQTVLFITGVADPRSVSTPMFAVSLVVVLIVGGVMVANFYYNKSLFLVCMSHKDSVSTSSWSSSSSVLVAAAAAVEGDEGGSEEKSSSSSSYYYSSTQS